MADKHGIIIITLTLGVNFVLLNQFLHYTQLAPPTCCTQKLGFVLITATATTLQVEGNVHIAVVIMHMVHS